jgi:hypothetical protein
MLPLSLCTGEAKPEPPASRVRRAQANPVKPVRRRIACLENADCQGLIALIKGLPDCAESVKERRFNDIGAKEAVAGRMIRLPVRKCRFDGVDISKRHLIEISLRRVDDETIEMGLPVRMGSDVGIGVAHSVQPDLTVPDKLEKSAVGMDGNFVGGPTGASEVTDNALLLPISETCRLRPLSTAQLSWRISRLRLLRGFPARRGFGQGPFRRRAEHFGGRLRVRRGRGDGRGVVPALLIILAHPI